MDACSGMDYIVHAGALSSPWGKYEQFYEANVLGTRYILQGAKLHRVKRMVHVSTPSIYFRFNDDEGTDGQGVREQQALPKQLVNFYAETKWLAEQLVDEAVRLGVPVLTIRPRAIFGEGDNALMPKLIAVNDKIGVPLFNGGLHRMDVTYVGNVVHAIALCLQADAQYIGEKYNITNGEVVQFKALLTETFARMGRPFKPLALPYPLVFQLAGVLEWTHAKFLHYKEPTLTKYSVSVLAKSQTLNIEKARRELGYEPIYTVQQGIERYVKWYKEEGN